MDIKAACIVDIYIGDVIKYLEIHLRLSQILELGLFNIS